MGWEITLTAGAKASVGVRLRPNRGFPARPGLQRRPTCFGRLPLILPIGPVAHPFRLRVLLSRRDQIGRLILGGEVDRHGRRMPALAA